MINLRIRIGFGECGALSEALCKLQNRFAIPFDVHLITHPFLQNIPKVDVEDIVLQTVCEKLFSIALLSLKT